MKFSIKQFAVFLLLSLLVSLNTYADKKFTLVIDAGHGGHDSGAIGKLTNEKTINLAVALKFGQLVEENYPDVKVVYTRKTDVFIPLIKRSEIANTNKADLFVSIHTNAARSTSAYGTETFVLGLAKTQSNLDVAMRENSVITLEDDYKVKYNGFNPNSIDSYIMFEFMQDRNLDKSLRAASLIEQQFSKKNRHSRGVRQAGFLVLHQTAAPSVLVELGFISNTNEERYLRSDKGKSELANSIYDAFKEYKLEYDKKSAINHVVSPLPENQNMVYSKIETSENKLVYKVQLFALKKELTTGSKEFKGLKGVEHYFEDGLYKYIYGSEDSYEGAVKLHESIKTSFPGSYLIAFYNGKKISISEAKNK